MNCNLCDVFIVCFEKSRVNTRELKRAICGLQAAILTCMDYDFPALHVTYMYVPTKRTSYY